MPNFTIVIPDTANEAYTKELEKSLLCFSNITSDGDAEVYKITPETFWLGMNICPEVDFIKLLQDNSEEIPDNVLTELRKYSSRFGVISLVGPDCLKVGDTDLMKEILNNTNISNKIYEQDDNLIFFKDISFVELQSLFSREIGYPIKVRKSQVQTFFLKICEKKIYAVLASNEKEAVRALYGKDENFDEDSLRKRLKLKRDITSEDITKYMEDVYKDGLIQVGLVNQDIVFDTSMRFIFF